MRRISRSLIIGVIVFFSVAVIAQVPFIEAPNNGFEKMGPETKEAQLVKAKFQNRGADKFKTENLRNLSEKDFVQINHLKQKYLDQAMDLIRAGKVIVVDSVVGNATRLGNPAGGKGAVEISDGITFLDAKIIRLAVDSYMVGAPIKQILWTSEENKDAVEQILSSLGSRLHKMTKLSSKLKSIIRSYLNGQHITLMAQSTLVPVIDAQTGDLAPERMRNLGAGEMVPTIYRSGADKLAKLAKDSIIIFSNIDFDLSYLHVVAASLAAGRPDLMQVHIKTKASGGSAYWVNENGDWRIIPLEEIEVPKEVLEKSMTLNANTVVMQGQALDPQFYDGLPLPFEPKNYDGKDYFLPKLSLSDIGKHPKIRSAVAIGEVDEYFFTGSKNTEMLLQTGRQEIQNRVQRWEARHKATPKAQAPMCSAVYL